MGPAKRYKHGSRSPDLLEMPITGHRVDKVQEQERRSEQASDSTSNAAPRSISCRLEEEDHYQRGKRNAVGKNEPILSKEAQSVLPKTLLSLTSQRRKMRKIAPARLQETLYGREIEEERVLGTSPLNPLDKLMTGTTSGHVRKIDNIGELQEIVTEHCMNHPYQNPIQIRCEPDLATVHILSSAMIQNAFWRQVLFSELADGGIDFKVMHEFRKIATELSDKLVAMRKILSTNSILGH